MQTPLNDPEFMSAQLRKPFGKFSTDIADFMAKSNKLIYELTLSQLALKPGQQVLEIGPADGTFVPLLFEKEPNLFYTGIDYSKEMTEAATEKNINLKAEGKATFIHGDAEQYQSAEKVDVIFSINTIYFWNTPKETLENLKHLLTSEGQLLLSFRSAESMRQLPFSAFNFTLYESEEVVSLLKKAGFSLIDFKEAEEHFHPKGGSPLVLRNIVVVARL